jgi:hypothetical protein
VDVWGIDELDRVLSDPRAAGRLGQVIAAADSRAAPGLFPGEDTARTAFRAAFPVTPARTPRPLSRLSGRAVAVALCGGLVLTGGAAAAAVGALPVPAQRTAKSALARLGVNIPGPHEHTRGLAGRHAQPTGGRHLATAQPTDAQSTEEHSGRRNEVSALARTTTLTGVDKGAAVSGLASEGRSQAGQHGKPASSTTGKAQKTPRPHPNKHRHGDTPKPEAPGAAHVPSSNHAAHPGQVAERP